MLDRSGLGSKRRSRLPRYFFTLINGQTHPDPEGEVLADDDAARRSAAAVMYETMRQHCAYVLAGGRYTVTVTDKAGREVCQLTLEDRVRQS